MSHDEIFGKIFNFVLDNKRKTNEELVEMIQQEFSMDLKTAEGYFDSVNSAIEQNLLLSE